MSIGDSGSLGTEALRLYSGLPLYNGIFFLKFYTKAFVDYIKKLGYTEEGFKKILVGQLERSANYYLNELKNGEAKVEWSDKAVFKDADHPTLEEIAKNYIAGYYTKTGGSPGGMPGGMAGGPPGGKVVIIKNNLYTL